MAVPKCAKRAFKSIYKLCIGRRRVVYITLISVILIQLLYFHWKQGVVRKDNVLASNTFWEGTVEHQTKIVPKLKSNRHNFDHLVNGDESGRTLDHVVYDNKDEDDFVGYMLSDGENERDIPLSQVSNSRGSERNPDHLVDTRNSALDTEHVFSGRDDALNLDHVNIDIESERKHMFNNRTNNGYLSHINQKRRVHSNRVQPSLRKTNITDKVNGNEQKGERHGSIYKNDSNTRYLRLMSYWKCPFCDHRKGGENLTSYTEHDLIVANLSLTSVRNDTCNGCNKHIFNYVIAGDYICSGRKYVDLVFLITTSHAHFKQRAVLRDTWLTLANHSSNIAYAFLLGGTADKNLSTLVEKENFKYRDMIKEDFVDSYTNLTYKTIMALKWITNRCSHAKYIMKTDDDMFVDPAKLVRLLHDPYVKSKLEHSVMGNCWKSKPIRDQKSKYFTSYERYPHYYFPYFCSGTGYVMSMHIAESIYDISQNIPFFHLEDVYVGMCLKELGLKTYRKAGFSVTAKYPVCYLKLRTIYSLHVHNITRIHMMWNSCKSYRIKTHTRDSYRNRFTGNVNLDQMRGQKAQAHRHYRWSVWRNS